MAAHVLGKPIVLFFFECMVIESAGIPGQFVCKRRKQEIYEFRIVENAMNSDYSWKESAREYKALYEKLMGSEE